MGTAYIEQKGSFLGNLRHLLTWLCIEEKTSKHPVPAEPFHGIDVLWAANDEQNPALAWTGNTFMKKFTENRTSITAWGRFYFLWILHHLSVRTDLCNQEMWPFQSGTCSVVHICFVLFCECFPSILSAAYPKEVDLTRFAQIYGPSRANHLLLPLPH